MIKKTYILILLFGVICSLLFAGKVMPEMTFLAPSPAAPPPDVKNITADSARIVSPRVRSVISADTVLYEIEPLLSVDSVMLFVRHSDIIDTIGVISSPPYRAVWRCSSVPDQDQIHLQFGYLLYLPDSVVVKSPPQPHRWALVRARAPSKKEYPLKQLAYSDEFEVNGDLKKWDDEGAETGYIADKNGTGTIAEFRLLWTAAKLHFIIEVKDRSATVGDFVELHLDFHRDRAKFSGVNHRSVRFTPFGHVMSFVVDLTDSGFVYNDSVNVLINEEMERFSTVRPDGYVIEASIPITVISDLGLPPSMIGLDVSVMNVDKGSAASAYYSWSGAGRFERYSPSTWGSAKIVQSSTMLRLVFTSTFMVIVIAVIAYLLHTLVTAYRQRRHEQMEDDVYSQLSESVIAGLEKDHDAAVIEDGDVVDDDDDDYEPRRRNRLSRG